MKEFSSFPPVSEMVCLRGGCWWLFSFLPLKSFLFGWVWASGLEVMGIEAGGTPTAYSLSECAH